MKLPSKKSKSDVTLKESIWWIYGAPGIGKSSLANSFGDVLFLHDDPGVRPIEAYKLKCSTWSKFTKAVKLLDKGGVKKYDAIAIDKIETMYTYALIHFCNQNGIKHISDLEWGKGYDMIRIDFLKTITTLVGLGKAIIFISDSKTVQIEGAHTKVDKITPAVKGACAGIIFPLVDICGYIGFKNGEESTENRRIFFSPLETRDAKNRDGMLPNSVPLPSASTGLADIIAAVKKKKKKKKK